MEEWINKLLSRDCRPLAFILSLGLSWWLSCNTLVNNDGILYLRSAAFILEGQWLAALNTYYWLFYSSLIAGMSWLVGLPLEQSAFVLNALLYAALTLGFITLIKLLGGDTRVQWLALAVVLVHTGLNDYRDSIVRDFGMWAFTLWAVYYLIKYAEHAQFRYVLGWSISIVLAFLFRIEAFLFLLLAPLGFYICMPQLSFKQKTLAIIKAQSLLLCAFAILFLTLLLTNKLHYLGRLNELPQYLKFILFESLDLYQAKAVDFSETMSVFFKPKHGMVALFGGLLTYTLYLLIKLLSPLYTLLLGYGIYRKVIPNHYAVRMIIWFIVIFALVLLGHLLQHFFFSSRYLMPPVLLLMLWVPFAIDALIILGKKRLLIAVAIVMIYMFGDGLISLGYSKTYIKEAGVWLANNEPQAEVYTNSKQVAYYANNASIDWSQDFEEGHTKQLLSSQAWKEYDLLALRHSKKTTELNEMIANLPHTVIIQDFYNKRGDGVVIIKTNDLSQPAL